MKLIAVTDEHLVELMQWFDSEDKLKQWSGPDFRYPFDLQSFKQDLSLATHPSFVLIDENVVYAFGQFYLRNNRCHLCRLAVNPDFRGQGVVKKLIIELMVIGKKQLNVGECSLFVLQDNTSAITAYQRYGFKFAKYNGEIEADNCLYMTTK